MPPRYTLRRLELLGILLALLIAGGTLLLAQVGLAYQQGESVGLHQGEGLDTLLLFGGALAGASLLLGRQRRQPDQTLLPVVALLGGLSLVFLYRFLIAREINEGGEWVSYWETHNVALMASQGTKFMIGIVAMLVVTSLPGLIRWWRDHRNLTFLSGLFLLVVTIIFGEDAGGGQMISLNLGVGTIQPVELIKVLFMGYVASYLATRQADIQPTYRFGIALPGGRFLFPLVITLVLAGVLLFWLRDLGAMLVILFLFPLLCYVGFRERIFWPLFLGLVGLGLVILLLLPADGCWLPATVCHRILIWQDPFSTIQDPYASSYQLVSGYYAMAAGGILGQGIGLGMPNGIAIPVLESDMIFVGIVEELGLVGAVALLGIYLFFLWRGLAIARQQGELFHKLLATGIVALFGAQLLVILGGNLGLLPLTGITLPFLSAGGTSVLVNLALVGLLLSLSTTRLPATSLNDSAWRALDQRVGRLQHFFGVAFIVLAIGVGYWTVAKSGELTPSFTNFKEDNSIAYQRREAWLQRVERGSILARDGSLLVSNGEQGRLYQDRSLIHTMGAVDPRTGEGLSGLEESENAALLGAGNWNLGVLFARYFDGRWRGNDLRLTIEPRWQQAAHEALGDYDGAVVVLDAHSGALLAMVSHPLYDPAQPGDPTFSRREQVNRVVQELYPPGSTFKTVVGAIAMKQGLVQPDSLFDFSGDEWFAGNCHRRYYGGDEVPSCNTPGYLPQMTFTEGFYWSDNVLFAELATRLGGQSLWEEAATWGFGQAIPFDMPVITSSLSSSVVGLNEADRLARTGFGQQDVVATPLQMALVAATVVNDGVVPRPYLVEAVLAPDGGTVRAVKPQPWQRALPSEVAAPMAEVMQRSVEEGWASHAAVEGAAMGGKTGTAEWAGSLVGGLPHSWFIGFATLLDGRTVAIAVIAEGAGDGSEVAAPIAGAVIRAGR